MEKIILNAKKNYDEFCAIFQGKSFSEIQSIVISNNMSYGSEKPDNDETADINYKSILATIVNHDGICFISSSFEVYDEFGQFIGNYSI